METKQPEKLSARETQIARLAAQGLTDKEIARKVGVSITTIRTYWMRIRRKVGASNRAQAIVQAIEQGRTNDSQTTETNGSGVDAEALGVVAISAEGDILAANNSFLNMVGHDRSTLENEGLVWDDLVIEDPISHGDEPKSTDIPPQAGTLRHRDGHSIPVLATGATIDGNTGIDVSCVVDLSDAKPSTPSKSNT